MFRKFNKFFKLTFLFIFILAFISEPVLAKELRIIQFSDIHLDTKNPDKPVRKFASSVPMFKKAIFKVNILRPNIVVFSGDMVNKPVESEFDVFLKNAKTLNVQFYPVFGNHDVGVNGGLSKKTMISKLNQNCNWLNLEKPYYALIQNEYVFIFMDGTTDKIITSTGTFSNEALAFLDQTLSQYSDKKAIIVQHFPLMTPFKSASHEVTNKAQYLSILDKHKNVIMVLAGHYHSSKTVERNNVLHITTPSMIEYPHAFRYITVNSDKDKITIQSQMFYDRERNEDETKSLPVNKLKLGLKSDNDYTVTLKNNIQSNENKKVLGILAK